MARQRDERGAYALMTGLLAIFLMGIMAVSVDIGNAMARKSDVQGQADFAALAAGSELTGNSGTIPAAGLTAVMDSINENQPVNRNGACVSDTESCIQSTDQLTNGDLTVRIGDRLIDASVRGRLERLREDLLARSR